MKKRFRWVAVGQKGQKPRMDGLTQEVQVWIWVASESPFPELTEGVRFIFSACG